MCRLRCPKEDNSKTHIRKDVGFYLVIENLVRRVKSNCNSFACKDDQWSWSTGVLECWSD